MPLTNFDVEELKLRRGEWCRHEDERLFVAIAHAYANRLHLLIKMFLYLAAFHFHGVG